MKPETIVSISAILVLIGIFVTIPCVTSANARRQAYHDALLRRARKRWENSVNTCLDTLRRRFGK